MRKICYILFVSVITLLSGCTEATLYDRDEGYIQIIPEWETLNTAAPKSTYYYFYRDGRLWEPSATETSGEGYTGTLPTGTYNVLMHNTDCPMVSQQEMEDFLQAKMHADARSVDKTSKLFCEQDTYSLALEDVVIECHKTTILHPDPQRLNRTVTMAFTIDLPREFTKVSGELQGVYPSAYLTNGMPAVDDESAFYAVDFEAPITRNEGSTDLKLFGIRDPGNGTKYKNVVNLTLIDYLQTSFGVPVDISNTITEILKEYGGMIPMGTHITIPIRISQQGPSEDPVSGDIEEKAIVAEVEPWISDGTGSGVVQ